MVPTPMLYKYKSAIMHIRKKSIARGEVFYEVDRQVVPMVSTYKYLGCVINDHLTLKNMVEDRAAELLV